MTNNLTQEEQPEYSIDKNLWFIRYFDGERFTAYQENAKTFTEEEKNTLKKPFNTHWVVLE